MLHISAPCRQFFKGRSLVESIAFSNDSLSTHEGLKDWKNIRSRQNLHSERKSAGGNAAKYFIRFVNDSNIYLCFGASNISLFIAHKELYIEGKNKERQGGWGPVD